MMLQIDLKDWLQDQVDQAEARQMEAKNAKDLWSGAYYRGLAEAYQNTLNYVHKYGDKNG